jgi:CBS domain-containing protein
MKIKDIMSKPVQIDKSGRISEALDLMDKHHVRRLIVRHAGKLMGVITLRNVCESLGSRRKSNHPPSLFHVADAVSNSYAVFEPEEDVTLAINALKDVDSVVVVDGDILGAVSTADVIRHVTPDGTVSSVMKMPAIAPPDARVSFIRKMMMERGISRVPIMDGATLVGIVSESDVATAFRGVKRRSSQGHQDNNVERMLALDIMQADVVTAKPDTPLKDAARLMLERGIGALPVVNDERRLVGIVTRRDIVRAI